MPSPDPVRLAVPKAFIELVAGVTPDAPTALSIFRHARARSPLALQAYPPHRVRAAAEDDLGKDPPRGVTQAEAAAGRGPGPQPPVNSGKRTFPSCRVEADRRPDHCTADAALNASDHCSELVAMSRLCSCCRSRPAAVDGQRGVEKDAPTVLITGANRGIGLELAQAVRRERLECHCDLAPHCRGAGASRAHGPRRQAPAGGDREDGCLRHGAPSAASPRSITTSPSTW